MGVTKIERVPHDHLSESRDIIGPVKQRQEERQCVKYHCSKEREESATRATAERG